nr:hypothetical protein Q903MT_gene3509 [Picea sitchensis]
MIHHSLPLVNHLEEIELDKSFKLKKGGMSIQADAWQQMQAIHGYMKSPFPLLEVP